MGHTVSVALPVKVGLPEEEPEGQEEGVVRVVRDTDTVLDSTPVLLLDCVTLGVNEEEVVWEGLEDSEGLDESEGKGVREGEIVGVTQGEGVRDTVKEDEGHEVEEPVTPTETVV